MRFFQPRIEKCYKCSMPGPYRCKVAGCGLSMCDKHRVRKAGGDLCAKHINARLVQDDAVPATRFRDAGEAKPHKEDE